MSRPTLLRVLVLHVPSLLTIMETYIVEVMPGRILRANHIGCRLNKSQLRGVHDERRNEGHLAPLNIQACT